MDIVAGDARFEMGRVIGRILPVYRRNFPGFTALSAIAAIPYILLYFSPSTIALLYRQEAFYLVSLLLNVVVQAALIRATQTDLSGKRESFGAYLSVGFRFFLPILGITLASLLATLVGMILLIVPGFIALTAFSVSVAVCVTEHTGVIASMERSWALSSGHRWRIFGLLLIYFIILIGFEFALRPLIDIEMTGSRMGMPLFLPFALLSGLRGAVSTLLISIGTASLYHELRMLKESGGTEVLAAAFD